VVGDRVIELECPRQYDLGRTMGQTRRSRGDLNQHSVPGLHWRATRTPLGPASFRVGRLDDRLRLDIWGPGAAWIEANAAALTGLLDKPETFKPDHPLLGPLARKFVGVHFPRTLRMLEELVPTIFGQLVTSREAARSFRGLLQEHGDLAPGPSRLRILPNAETLARLPDYAYAPLGGLAMHARAIRAVAGAASKVETAVELPYAEALALLCSIRGIGPWTAAGALGVATGCADAIPLGDLHFPRTVAWALAREEEADDARMLELLAPFAGHRLRALYLIHVGRLGPARRGPRRPMRPI